jgi:hypothetical protein
MSRTIDGTVSVSGKIQEPLKVRPYDFGTDAIERQRVALGQSIIDADFEYGLQSTKWQSYQEIRKYPSFYEVPGTDVTVTAVTTDAATPSIITVTGTFPAATAIGNVYSIQGLANSERTADRAEGYFLAIGGTNSTTLKYMAKGKVGTNSGDSLLTSYTVVRRGGIFSNTTSNIYVSAVGSDGQTPSLLTAQMPNGAAHGLMPGTPLSVYINNGTSSYIFSSNVANVIRSNTFTFFANTSITGSLTANIYTNPYSYYVHRPFDGGVLISPAHPVHGASVVRQSKKVFRYQSGKGLLWSSGTLFCPNNDIVSVQAATTTTTTTAATAALTNNTFQTITVSSTTGFAVGQTILSTSATALGIATGPVTVTAVPSSTQLTLGYPSQTTTSVANPIVVATVPLSSNITVICDIPHGAPQLGATVQLRGITSPGYNGTYTVNSINDNRSLNVLSTSTLINSNVAVLGDQPRFIMTNWHGSSIRAGCFEDQNGLFWEWDGQTLWAVKRSSTFQTAGYVTVQAKQNVVIGQTSNIFPQFGILGGATVTVSAISAGSTSAAVTVSGGTLVNTPVAGMQSASFVLPSLGSNVSIASSPVPTKTSFTINFPPAPYSIPAATSLTTSNGPTTTTSSVVTTQSFASGSSVTVPLSSVGSLASSQTMTYLQLIAIGILAPPGVTGTLGTPGGTVTITVTGASFTVQPVASGTTINTSGGSGTIGTTAWTVPSYTSVTVNVNNSSYFAVNSTISAGQMTALGVGGATPNGTVSAVSSQTLTITVPSTTLISYAASGQNLNAANSIYFNYPSTRFQDQLKVGDRVTIRGMTHTVTQIQTQGTLCISPGYRGTTDITVPVKMCKIKEVRVPQSQFNRDTLDGNGPSGFKADLTKMQMIGLQYTWYGAGFVDFMMRGGDGNWVYAHRFRNNNVNDEAYMRTGNMPVRYEIVNESNACNSSLSAAMGASDTSMTLTDDLTYWPAGPATVMVDQELITYTSKSGSILSGLARSSNLNYNVNDVQNIFYGNVVTAVTTGQQHLAGTSVQLVSVSCVPSLTHWGSAFIMDGQFDSDRGYFFNYSNVLSIGGGVSAAGSNVFMIRLAPTVSNGIVGDLGQRELLNRAQLLLQKLEVVPISTGQASVNVTGILNPSGFELTSLNWQNISSSVLGSQPSFTQVAILGSAGANYVPGSGERIFSTIAPAGSQNTIDLTGLKELSNAIIGGNKNFPDGPDTLMIQVSGISGTVNPCILNLFWTEAQA